MTFKIDRESLGCTPDEFAGYVQAHIAALREYGAHLKGVRADAANEALKPEERRVAFPGPTASPVVEQAIKRELNPDGESWVFSADYELVGPSLEVRKQRLVERVKEAERVELLKVVPAGKQRYFSLLETELAMREAGLASPEDLGFLIAQKERRRKQTAIQLWAAKLEHDIEDLTEANIGSWELTPFNG